MQLIFGRENAEKLREKYTVLDLETLPTEDARTLEVYCLIPAEKMPISELPDLETYITLHNEFLRGYQEQQFNYCRQSAEYLIGKFGGEVDSFYEEIIKRIDSAEAQKSD